jgi:uncharacterized membrane protein YfcA
VLWGGLQQRQANANSLIAIIPIAIAAVPIYYYRHGQPQVDFHFALFLVLGAVVGAYLGARSLKYIPDRQLKLGVAVLILVLGVKYVVLP